MNQPEGSWWWPLVRCPYCGAEPGPGEACSGCTRRLARTVNAVEWIAQRVESSAPAAGWRRKLSAIVDPLRSPVLPFRYLTKRRTNTYYERTLADRELAMAWSRHYLRDLALPDTGATVLDFGCGRGRHAAILGQLGYRVVGQERQPHGWWQRLPSAGFQVVVDGRHAPWRDEAFDLVVEVGVLHYMPPDEARAHIHEVVRMLKPGGSWLLLEANAAGPGAAFVRKQVGELHALSDVRQWVAAGGLQEIDINYEGYYSAIAPSLVNYVRKQLSPRSFDLADFDSRLAARTEPEQRGLWCLRARKPLA